MVVLILVLVEDTLGVWKLAQKCQVRVVLILVLVEDTLGGQKDYILDYHLFKRVILQYLTF